MNTKATWVGSIATVVIAGIAVVTLLMQYSNEAEKSSEATPTTGQGIEREKEVTDDLLRCSTTFEPLFRSAQALTLSIDRNEGYENIVDGAIKEKCFSEAVNAAQTLSTSIARDDSLKKIYQSAIRAEEYGIARDAIEKLSISLDRDEGNRILLRSKKN